MNEQNKISLDLPYPPAKADGYNLYFASLLTNDFAGPVSEFSAISDYTFQSFVAGNQQVASLVAGIARIEMQHLQLIGQLIVSLGGNPRFAVQSGCKTNFWNGRLTNYCTMPRDFLHKDIANERAAIENYRRRLEQIADSGVHAVLERIILDEEHHIVLYGQMLAELSAENGCGTQQNAN